jgi:hypothetical protein
VRQKIRLEGHVGRQQAREQYLYVPFEMPAGARRLDVSYFYDNQVLGAQEFNPGNNIDIGIFDVRGAGFLRAGFRGWSGGARAGFHITPQAATPGYLRGPLQAGEWNIIFGCSKISDESVRYRVNVEIEVDPHAAEEPHATEVPIPGASQSREPDRADRAGEGGRWYRGDLHAHSEHSDGANSVEEIVKFVRDAGLDYFALTDHNTISHWDELARLNHASTLLIPGEEITMYGGHANVWGLDDWIDFRGSDDDRVQALIEDAHARGSMFSINHPDSPIPWLHEHAHGYGAIEVWNAPWRYYNEPALLRWEGALLRGERIVAVGGSDSHCIPPAPMTQPNLPGEPCTWVYVEGALSQRAVLEAIERGRVFVSESPQGPYIDMRVRCGLIEALPGDVIESAEGRHLDVQLTYHGPDGKKLRLHGRDGLIAECVAEREDYTTQLQVPAEGDGFVRCEVRGYRGRPDRGEVLHAMTNPVYWGNW